MNTGQPLSFPSSECCVNSRNKAQNPDCPQHLARARHNTVSAPARQLLGHRTSPAQSRCSHSPPRGAVEQQPTLGAALGRERGFCYHRARAEREVIMRRSVLPGITSAANPSGVPAQSRNRDTLPGTVLFILLKEDQRRVQRVSVGLLEREIPVSCLIA